MAYAPRAPAPAPVASPVSTLALLSSPPPQLSSASASSLALLSSPPSQLASAHASAHALAPASVSALAPAADLLSDGEDCFGNPLAPQAQPPVNVNPLLAPQAQPPVNVNPPALQPPPIVNPPPVPPISIAVYREYIRKWPRLYWWEIALPEVAMRYERWGQRVAPGWRRAARAANESGY